MYFGQIFVKNGRILKIFSGKIGQIVGQILDNFSQILIISTLMINILISPRRFMTVEIAYASVPNKQEFLIVGDREFFRKSNEPRNWRGPNKQSGKLGNLYLKIRHIIMFFMPISKLTHSFSTSIQLAHIYQSKYHFLIAYF